MSKMQKGKRPSEIDSLKAQLKHAQAALRLSTREVVRQEGLSQVPGAAVELEVDRARAARDQDRQRVAQLQADLDTALLGSRTDQVIAAEAEVHAREAALARADWEFAQKRRQAPKSADWCSTLLPRGRMGAAPATRRRPAAAAKISKCGRLSRRLESERFIPVTMSRSPWMV